MAGAKNKKTKQGPLRGAFLVIKDSFRAAHRHPQIFVYPYVALLFTSATYSFVSATVLPSWYSRVFHAADYVAPHKVAAILGIVGFSAFYTALVAAYFSTAVASSVLAILEERKVPLWYGVEQVVRNFGRVTWFALMAVFFFPVGIYAQRRKLREAPVGVIGSSFTLHMAQVAPAVLASNKSVGDTIRDSIDTLGRAWRQGLVLKIGLYLIVFVLFVLPKVIQHHWFKSQAASNIGWLVSLELVSSSYVTFKVINSIFTAVLYHQAKTQKNT